MVDTVKFRITGKARASPMGGWVKKAEWPKQWVKWHHPETGMRAKCHESGGVRIEVSLPRIERGLNSLLITRNDQIESALEKVREVLSALLRSANWDDLRFMRVDIAWQVKGKIRKFIWTHQEAKLPKFHHTAVIHAGETIRWKGKELSIQFYDKRKKQDNLPGEYVRVEMKLTGKKLRDELGAGDVVRKLDADTCYQALRKTLLKFQPKKTFIVCTSKEEIYYHAMQERWKIHGLPALELMLLDHSEDTRKRIMRTLDLLRFKKGRIDWNELLPPNKPKLRRAGDYSFFDPQ